MFIIRKSINIFFFIIEYLATFVDLAKTIEIRPILSTI